MTSITFDRLHYMENLKAAGLPEAHARAHAVALDEALRDTVATQADVQLIKTDIQMLRMEMRELELRLTVKTGAMIMALGGVLVAIKFLG